MGIFIGNYEFKGPYKSPDRLEEKQGLCAVLHVHQDEYELVDVSESQNVQADFRRMPEASPSTKGAFMVAVCYTNELGQGERQGMVAEIKKEFAEPTA
jgi:hypothetical protein